MTRLAAGDRIVAVKGDDSTIRLPSGNCWAPPDSNSYPMRLRELCRVQQTSAMPPASSLVCAYRALGGFDPQRRLPKRCCGFSTILVRADDGPRDDDTPRSSVLWHS